MCVCVCVYMLEMGYTLLPYVAVWPEQLNNAITSLSILQFCDLFSFVE